MTTPATPHPEPPWLVEALDARIAYMQAAMGGSIPDPGIGIVMTHLTEPASDDTVVIDRWERTCDRCGTYCNSHTNFYTGHAVRVVDGVQVLVAFGVCSRCT